MYLRKATLLCASFLYVNYVNHASSGHMNLYLISFYCVIHETFEHTIRLKKTINLLRPVLMDSHNYYSNPRSPVFGIRGGRR